jgi:hypothetical protein
MYAHDAFTCIKDVEQIVLVDKTVEHLVTHRVRQAQRHDKTALLEWFVVIIPKALDTN